MSRLKITKTFEKDGDTYEEGKTYVVTEEVAKWAKRKGYGSKPGEKTEETKTPKLEVPKSEDVWDELKRKAKSERDKPPNWNPERGDWLFGTVEKTGEGEDNRFAVVRVAKAPVKAKQTLGEGKYRRNVVQPGSKILLWEVKDLSDFFDRIRGGSKVAVQYTGKIRTSSGHKAKLFDCAVRL